MTMERRLGWYFNDKGELRECLVVTAGMGVGMVAVLDVETGEPVDVAVQDVLAQPSDEK